MEKQSAVFGYSVARLAIWSRLLHVEETGCLAWHGHAIETYGGPRCLFTVGYDRAGFCPSLFCMFLWLWLVWMGYLLLNLNIATAWNIAFHETLKAACFPVDACNTEVWFLYLRPCQMGSCASCVACIDALHGSQFFFFSFFPFLLPSPDGCRLPSVRAFNDCCFAVCLFDCLFVPFLLNLSSIFIWTRGDDDHDDE